jgi:hypothetical protein
MHFFGGVACAAAGLHGYESPIGKLRDLHRDRHHCRSSLLFVGQKISQIADNWSSKQDDWRHHDPRYHPGTHPVNKE